MRKIRLFVCLAAIVLTAVHASWDGVPEKVRNLNYSLTKLKEEQAKTNWLYNGKCKSMDFAPIEQCLEPESNTCFGSAIPYSHVTDESFELPVELKVLETIPNCWNHLKNLLCISKFRPCKMHETYVPRMKKILNVKHMQTFSQQSCLKAKQACQFLVDRDQWPKELNCIGNEQLFNQQCKLPTNYSFQIDWNASYPMVSLKNDVLNSDKGHLMADLYLPCHSTFVDPQNLIHVKTFIVLLCTILGVVSFALTAKLLFNSKNLFQILSRFSIGLYFASWSILLIILLEGKSMHFGCQTVEGKSIRLDNKSSHLDQCSIQSFLLNFLILNAYEWRLMDMYFKNTESIRNRILAKRIGLKNVTRSVLHSRLFVSIAIELLIVLLSWLSSGVELCDGIIGVCYAPLSPILKNSIFYAVILFFICINILMNYQIKNQYKSLPSTTPDENCQFSSTTPNSSSLNMSFLMKNRQMMLFMIEICAFITTIVLHFTFSFNAMSEREQLLKIVECRFDLIQEMKGVGNETQFLKKINQCDVIQKMTFFDYVHLVSYIFALPTTLFICLMIESWNEKSGSSVANEKSGSSVANENPTTSSSLPDQQQTQKPIVQSLDQKFDLNYVFAQLCQFVLRLAGIDQQQEAINQFPLNQLNNNMQETTKWVEGQNEILDNGSNRYSVYEYKDGYRESEMPVSSSQVGQVEI